MRRAHYNVLETVHQDRCTTVVRAVRETDDRAVLLKTLDLRNCGGKALERLRHEYELAASLKLRSVVRPLALETHDGMPALVLEDGGGRPLEGSLSGPMAIERFLELAVSIAGAVAEIHGAGVIHKDLKPDNILVHPTTGEVWLADFGLATRLPLNQQAESEPPRVLEGSLPYVSPEQTGRTNRPVDSRSDLYSLGMVFYRMVTGRLPFEAEDPIAWVHFHVARAPAPPSQWVPALPEPLTRIVLKLLAKRADDRYQSAAGLRHDLARCLDQWRAHGRIDPFPLGERDASDRFQIPAKLYGRERELSALRAAFERVAATGRPELALVAGPAGIGKSALVLELARSTAAENALFLSGKFEKDKREIPYSTAAQAFRKRVLDILAGEEEQIASWRRQIQAALGPNGQLMVALVPQLELLIGKQPPVAGLPLGEAKGRFHRVFRQFLRVFATREHPLVGFLDDLQWADSATLELLADTMTHPDTRYLLTVGAYRDSEIDAAHPLIATLERVRGAGVPVHAQPLPPLSRPQLGRLIADAMRRRPEQVGPLTDLVAEKTAGNPFFALQFLTSLHDDGLIRFDPEGLAWTCDIEGARARGYTDNVAELMVAKLRRLPPETREALELAACVGHTVEASTLGGLRGRDAEQTWRDLAELVREGLLRRSGDRYSFPHDRIQQAAYELIPEAHRREVHLRVGRLLLAETPDARLSERIFDIVNQLNRSTALLRAPEERLRVARLNQLAARRATTAAAYGPAAGYLAAGIALLPAEAWRDQYDLTYALHLQRARCEYLAGGFRDAEQSLDLALLHARTRADQVAAYRVRIEVSITRGEIERAIRSLLDSAALFGLALEAHPQVETVRDRYASVLRALGARSIEELAALPRMSDPAIRALLDAFVEGYPAAAFFDTNLVFALLCESVRLTIEYGTAPSSPLAYAALGTYVGPLLGEYRDASRFGKLGYELTRAKDLTEHRVGTLLAYGYHCRIWTDHVATALPYLEEAMRTGLETGALNYACYCTWHLIVVMLARGDPLHEVDLASARHLAFVRNAHYGDLEDMLLAQRRLIHRLRGIPEPPDERAGLDRRIEGRVPMATFTYDVRAQQERFLFGDPRASLRAARKADRTLWTSQVVWERCEHSLFLGLGAAACCAEAPPGEREELVRTVRTEAERNRVWAETCPENFHHRHALLAAELAHLEGRELDAERSFEEAIRAARGAGFVQSEALAWEQASKFYRARDLGAVAEAYLREARGCYVRWGADAKVRQLDRLLPHAETRPLPASPTLALPSEQLDLLSVVKASQTISGELLLDKLAATLLQVALEQGGARRGCLLLVRDDGLAVEAEAAVEGEGVTTRVLPSQPVDPSRVPLLLVRKAQAERAPVIFDRQELEDATYANDPYLSVRRPHSALCLPILRRTTLVGLLYLENDLVSGAFTPDRLAALGLIASQAAISTENARLVQSLREADRRKDEFLALLGHELRNPLAPIRNSVFVLERTPGLDPRTRKAVAVIERQGRQLSRLVDDLLEATRVARGKVRLQRSRMDLAELVQRTAEDFQTRFSERKLELGLHLHAAPVWVDGDPARLAQVLGNLLSNAAKFTPSGGRVGVHVSRDDSGRAVLEVEDTGEGIDAETLAHLFQPFAQGARALDRSQGGLGLGLALVKGIVALHGGQVRAESEGPGRGSRFTVKLPLTEPPAATPPPPTEPEGGGAGRRVLLIEDNRDAAETLREVLELQGFRVTVAASGPEGVQKAHETRPDAVVCDIGLPAGMDGYAVARALRADPRTAATLLIALTGYAQPEDRRLAQEAGFDAHLAKPPDLDALARLLGRGGVSGEAGAPG